LCLSDRTKLQGTYRPNTSKFVILFRHLLVFRVNIKTERKLEASIFLYCKKQPCMCACGCRIQSQSQSYITTDSLGVRHTSGTRDQFFFLLEIFFRQLRVCYVVAPSLKRGRVCYLLLLLILANAVPLESESCRTQDHILLPQFLRLPQPGESGPRIYIPQEQGGLDIPPSTGFPFRRLLRLAELRWRYSMLLHAGCVWMCDDRGAI
jgi:hypothetical protein